LIALPAAAAGYELGEPPRFERAPRAGFELDLSAEPLALEPELQVDTGNRAEVGAFFESAYLTAFEPAMGWADGSADRCDPGQTSLAYEDATIQLVNFYRAMAGLPGDVQLDGGLSGKCQDAALMMKAQREISHTPTPDWACYTLDAGEAAGSSNLALGLAGPHAIRAYVEDFGDNNQAVGHRRWILYPPQTTMGTGSVPGRWEANCLWVVDRSTWIPPRNEPEWIAWPPAGFVPYELVYPRWSFSMANADFTGATVSMSLGDESLALSVLPLSRNIADSTLVWEPEGIVAGRGIEDRPYWVRVNFSLGGSPRSVAYVVNVIDRLPEPSAQSAALAVLATLAVLALRARVAARHHQRLR